MKNTIEDNRYESIKKLMDTDWVEFPSVSDPNNSPYLVNKKEFDAYRLWLRNFVVNPEAGEIKWPVKPESIWK